MRSGRSNEGKALVKTKRTGRRIRQKAHLEKDSDGTKNGIILTESKIDSFAI